MLRSCALLAVMTALAFVSGAAAKGPISLEICGATGCVDADDEISGAIPFSDSDAPLDQFDSASPLAPYYELRLDAEWLSEAGPRFYVPVGELLKIGSNWIRVDPLLAARLERAVRDLAPFPPPVLTRVVVAGRVAADPSAYAAFFDSLPRAELPVGTERVEIVLEASRPTPWTSDEPLVYHVGTGIIRRDGEWFALSAVLADTVESDSGVAPAASQPPVPEPPAADDFPWAAVVGAAGGLLVLLSVALVTLRGAPGRPRARPS